jgi:hypothetical protein
LEPLGFRDPVALPARSTAWIGIGLLLYGVVPQVAATPPCMSPEYEVSYASPVWSVRILRIYPHSAFWFEDPRNGTYDNLYNHITRGVSEDEPVTLFDRDGDREVSANDTILVWDPEGDDRFLRFTYGDGPNFTPLTGPIVLEDGWRHECMGNPPNRLWDFACIGTISMSLLAIVLAWSVWRKHRSSRRMPF